VHHLANLKKPTLGPSNSQEQELVMGIVVLESSKDQKPRIKVKKNRKFLTQEGLYSNMALL